MSHFNIDANKWDTKDKVERAHFLANKMKEELTKNRELDILDFGCGTGLLGLEFLDYSKSLLGIDNSSGMLEVFDEKTKNLKGVSSLNINLEKEELNKKFDLIISSMTFHHLDRPSAVLEMFSSMLKKEGKILIIDLETEDGTFHPDNKGMGVKHLGFSKDDLQVWADQSKMSVDIKTIYSIDKNQKSYNLFLATFS